MGNYTIPEQAQLTYDTDIMVGVHGQALTWGTFLRTKINID